MRNAVAGSASLVGLATLGLVAALALRPVPTGTVLDAYVLALGAIGLLVVVRATRSASPARGLSRLEAALARTPGKIERPAQLARVEREVDVSIANAFYLHYRLRPLLRDIAAARLEAHHGVALDRPTENVRTLLPADGWELLRADRPEPRDREAPGIPLPRLRAIVEALERL